MIATATNGSPRPARPNRNRRAWTPDARDHLIYQWVKFDGMKQIHAAADFGISQATVSRIIDRYERWQAHADPREGGRLDAAERRRAQRWLTYERNELIVASALRIADRMEGVTELHKSVRTKPRSEWHKEGTEIRSEEQSVDRHGVAARFLRLAFRVNMEQLKLVEQDPPPLPGPLSAAELAEEEQRDAAVAESFALAERRSQEQIDQIGGGPVDGDASAVAESEPAAKDAVLGTDPPTARPTTADNLHKVHTAGGEDLSTTAIPPCTCAAEAVAPKNANQSCIADPDNGGQRAITVGESERSPCWNANESFEIA